MHLRAFIIGFMLCGKLSYSQLSGSYMDSLNAKMLKLQPVSLTGFGWSRIHLKNGTVLLNCLIIEVKNNGIIYKKNGTLHDKPIEKIATVWFEEHPLKLRFDELNRGKLVFNN